MPSRATRAVLGGGMQLVFLSVLVASFRGEAQILTWAWVVLMSAWAAAEAALQSPDERPDPADLPSALGAAALLGVVLLGLSSTGDVRWDVRLGGLSILAVGASLRAWAVHTLGRSFRARPAAGPALVITHGPYASLRHPGELGLVLACFGSALALGAPAALGACVFIVAPLARWRVLREEAAMQSGAREAYTLYRSRVPRWGAITRRA